MWQPALSRIVPIASLISEGKREGIGRREKPEQS